MKPNSPAPPQKLQLPTPNPFNMPNRGRLFSFNTPQLSPMRMIQSPYPIGNPEASLFDGHLMQADFRLEEGVVEEPEQQIEESSDESVEQMEFPKFLPDQKVTKDNMVDFLVDTINIDEDRVVKVHKQLQQSGPSFLGEVFQYLYKRFKKVKKTKEEMIKYTMRKSFKYITDQMKKDDPSLVPLLSTDGLEGMCIYFGKHSQDQDISIPFKKNSLEKTMNTAFLKKVFSVYRFYRDYKKFLKTFQNEFLKDNRKKMATMNEAVKQSVTSKNYKSLQNFKRLPWTKDILMKLKQFAYELLNYSPFVKEGCPRPLQNSTNFVANPQNDINDPSRYEARMDLSVEHQKPAPKRSIDSLNYDSGYRDINDYLDGGAERDEMQLFEKKQKKKSVIILTPPFGPSKTEPKMSDLGLSLD